MVLMMKKSLGLALAVWILAAAASAQVVSASLEYSSTAPVKFYLNGVEFKNPESADEHVTDYALISSADGAFPLGLLKYGQPNVLAVAQKNLMRNPIETYMLLSYCLTLRMASGELLKVVGRPQNSKCLYVKDKQPVAADWSKPGFDDATWKAPQYMGLESQYFALAELPDPEGGRPLRFLARDFTGRGQGGDSVYFRQSFTLAPQPAPMRVYSYSPGPKRGEKPVLALIPDKSSMGLGDIEVSATLPAGLDPLASPGSHWDPGTRKLSWSYAAPAKFAALHLDSVLENKGFESPQVALGPWKTGRHYVDKRTAGEDFWRSVRINSGTSAWYKMSAPAFADGPSAPVILGVVFQSQIMPGGRKGALGGEGVDDLLLNYSVDGSNQGALKQDINLSRFGGQVGGAINSAPIDVWLNGYYVADTDRNWTWKDLANLRVHLQSKQHGMKHDSSLLSCIASVRYYVPSEVMPRFYVQVSEAGKKTLRIAGKTRSTQGNGESTGFLDLNVNP